MFVNLCLCELQPQNSSFCHHTFLLMSVSILEALFQAISHVTTISVAIVMRVASSMRLDVSI
jgi:hypothetical protein